MPHFRSLISRLAILPALSTALILASSTNVSLAQNHTAPIQQVGHIPPVHPSIAKEQLQLRILEKKLEGLLENGVIEGPEFENIVNTIQTHHERLYSLHEELRSNLQLRAKQQRGQSSEKKLIQEEKNQLEALLAAREKHWQKDRGRMQVQLKELQQELVKAHKELERSRENLSVSKPKKELRTSIYKTKHAEVERAADLLEDLLGDSVRVSVDSRTSHLLVKAADEVLQSVSRILSEIDTPADERPANQTRKSGDRLPSSAMVHLYWLCNGTPNKNAPSADSVLPKSVCQGLIKVGIHDPHLVSHATTSMALLRERDSFRILDIPMKVFGEDLTCSVEGSAEKDRSGKLILHLETNAKSPIGFGGGEKSINVFTGSIVTPLDHYVILGTNSYATSGQQTRGRSPGMGEYGGEFGGGFGGYGGEGGAGGEFGAAGEDGAAGRGGRGGGRVAREAEQARPDVTQFAYVVQVVAAETYEPEVETTSENK